MRTKAKTTTTKNRPSLAKGQIWKTKDFHVEIVELGKMLVHYRLLKELGQRRRAQMSKVESMEEYLVLNKARLLQALSLN